METWYVMVDGTCGDPREIVTDKDGKLRHKDGRAVDYAPHGPRSRGVDPEKERAKAAARSAKAEARVDAAKVADEVPAPAVKPPAVKEMVSEPPRQGYKNREIRGRKNRGMKSR